ncbi:LamG-like jellyroll fold domain-containing protein [Rhizobium sp.]|uniref:LamG-like jellyroll fold domain-containing protein n=1 Tax=Rhizobium sp. TaxID=391 RepID=UPI000E87561C|nr:hypothetical protein [Rhizobium sp.]
MVATFDYDLDQFLQRLRGWWSAQSLSGSVDGAIVNRIPDLTSHGQDMISASASTAPTLKLTGLNGYPTVNFATSKRLIATAMANGGIFQSAAIAQPFTMIAVAKARNADAGTARVILSSTSASQCSLLINSTDLLQIAAGSNGASGGPVLSDDAFHIVMGVFDTGSAAIFVDGYCAGAAAGQSHGTNTIAQFSMGSVASGASYFNGEIAEVMLLEGRPRLQEIKMVNDYLSAKWGLGLTIPSQSSATPIVSTDANGVACRTWLPTTITSNTPVCIVSHQAGGDSNIGLGYSMYPYIRELTNAGFCVIASDNGGTNTWANAAAQTSLMAAYNLAASQLVALGGGAGSVMLLGFSMGGGNSMIGVALGGFAAGKIKAVAVVDGVMDLSTLYSNATYTSTINTAHNITASTLTASTAIGDTSIPTTASFQTIGTQLMVGNGTANVEVVTTTAASTGTSVAVTPLTKTHASADQVSDYPAKTAGRSPVSRSANDYSGVSYYRFYASSADTDVPKTSNADAISALLATASPAPAEHIVVSHPGGHLQGGARAKDMVAFAARAGFPITS